jgi:hypothetical protein
MTLVLRNCDLDINGIIFNDPKPSGHGGQTIYANYQKDGRTHKSCLLQTPWMYNPFGLNASPPQPGEDPKYSVELSFGNSPSAYLQEFHDKMKSLDRHVVTGAITNQRTWLGRTDIDEDYIQEFYKPVVRAYKNKDKKATGEYPDTMRFKIPYYAGGAEDDPQQQQQRFSDLEVYDGEKNRIPVNSIDDLRTALGKGNRLRMIAQCHSVWQSGKEFGVSWRVKRIQVLSSEKGLGDDCAFASNSETDEDILVSNSGGGETETAQPAAFDDNNSDEEEQ